MFDKKYTIEETEDEITIVDNSPPRKKNPHFPQCYDCRFSKTGEPCAWLVTSLCVNGSKKKKLNPGPFGL